MKESSHVGTPPPPKHRSHTHIIYSYTQALPQVPPSRPQEGKGPIFTDHVVRGSAMQQSWVSLHQAMIVELVYPSSTITKTFFVALWTSLSSLMLRMHSSFISFCLPSWFGNSFILRYIVSTYFPRTKTFPAVLHNLILF